MKLKITKILLVILCISLTIGIIVMYRDDKLVIPVPSVAVNDVPHHAAVVPASLDTDISLSNDGKKYEFYGSVLSIKENADHVGQKLNVEVIKNPKTKEFGEIKGNVVINDPEKIIQKNTGSDAASYLFSTTYDSEYNWYTLISSKGVYIPTGEQ